jgi:hypothetical protein
MIQKVYQNVFIRQLPDSLHTIIQSGIHT